LHSGNFKIQEEETSWTRTTSKYKKRSLLGLVPVADECDPL